MVSYFQTLTDSAFLRLKPRGINALSDLIISKADRDAKPLMCYPLGGSFMVQSDPLPQFV